MLKMEVGDYIANNKFHGVVIHKYLDISDRQMYKVFWLGKVRWGLQIHFERYLILLDYKKRN